MNFQLTQNKNYEIKKTITLLNKAAKNFNIPLYFTGGIIRDTLLSKVNYDIDIFIEEFNTDFITYLEILFQIDFKIIYEFQNATTTLKNGVSIDISIMRKDFYPYPGALPLVSKGTFIENICRRDFTINSIVYDTKKIIDPSKGCLDLKKRQLRTLYSNSFSDDPTRILRGIKFSLRYNFNFEKFTEAQLMKSLKNNRLIPISFTRFYRELLSIFSEINLQNLFKHKRYKEILTQLFGVMSYSKIYEFSFFITKNKKLIEYINLKSEEIFEIYISLINYFRISHTLCSLAIENNFFKQRESFYFDEALLKFITEKKLNFFRKKDSDFNSNIFKSLKSFSNKELLTLLFIFKNDIHFSNCIKKFFKLKRTIPLISGKVLINKNFTSKKEFKTIIENSFLCQLNNPNYTIDDILREVVTTYELPC